MGGFPGGGGGFFCLLADDSGGGNAGCAGKGMDRHRPGSVVGGRLMLVRSITGWSAFDDGPGLLFSLLPVIAFEWEIAVDSCC